MMAVRSPSIENGCMKFLNRLFGRPDPAQPVRILRVTYAIEIRSPDHAYLTQETRWRSAVAGLTHYREAIPIGGGRIDRIRASLGTLRPVEEAPAGDPARQIRYEVDLPAPAKRDDEGIQVLSAILTDPFTAAEPGFSFRPIYPAEAIGLSIVFPLTQPPRDVVLARVDGAIPTPDDTPLQASSRADGREIWRWLKDSPPAGAAYRLTWWW